MEGNRIGIIGGGQLGRMLTEAAKPMGFDVTVIDPGDPPCPAAQAGAEHIQAGLSDLNAMVELASLVDVITWEIEHIDAMSLYNLQQETGIDVQPSPSSLLMIQDKLQQKNFLRKNGLPTTDFSPVHSQRDLEIAIHMFGPSVLKASRGGYDGRGNLVLDSPDWDKVQDRFGQNTDLFAEQKVDFKRELSVIIARDKSMRVATYPVIETIQEDGQCALAVAPARIAPRLASEATGIAHAVLDRLRGAGVFAVEMFQTKDDKILVNEIAPRVHNSGHLTIESNATSQFEQHIRAISGLALGSTMIISPAAMANILGERDGPVDLDGRRAVMEMPDTHLHIYGKSPTKKARKMGHITVRAETANEAVILATQARRRLTI